MPWRCIRNARPWPAPSRTTRSLAGPMIAFSWLWVSMTRWTGASRAGVTKGRRCTRSRSLPTRSWPIGERSTRIGVPVGRAVACLEMWNVSGHSPVSLEESAAIPGFWRRGLRGIPARSARVGLLQGSDAGVGSCRAVRRPEGGGGRVPLASGKTRCLSAKPLVGAPGGLWVDFGEVVRASSPNHEKSRISDRPKEIRQGVVGGDRLWRRRLPCGTQESVRRGRGVIPGVDSARHCVGHGARRRRDGDSCRKDPHP